MVMTPVNLKKKPTVFTHIHNKYFLTLLSVNPEKVSFTSYVRKDVWEGVAK